MGTNAVVIPPIKTNLNDPAGTPQTAKEWYYYWQKSGDRINVFNGMIAYGTHAARPLPANLPPDGALYSESDRSEVLYQYQNGAWHYVAGTMWGTLSPDTRPTGLGANDAGFRFQTTDTGSQYAGRTFIWSGSLWVETTAARCDTHANRLAASVGNIENGALWVETDRSEVIYQLQGSAWHYCAGFMWGTLSPDQRPADLGANDSGFHFRATDAQIEYDWSGTVWVELGANYSVNGTAVATRPGLNLIAGANVTVAGADNAASNRVDVTITAAAQPALSLFGVASAAVTLTGSYQNIPGCAVTLSRAGTWLIFMCFDFQTTNDAGATFVGNIPQASQGAIFLAQATAGRTTAFQQAMIAEPAGTVVQMQAVKFGGSGTSQVQTNSTIAALWVSP